MVKLEGNAPLNTDEQVLIDQTIAEEKRNIERTHDQIQGQIRELQARLKESILQHHEHIQELNHQRNMHSTTIRLPTEILHKIFQDLQDLYMTESVNGPYYLRLRDPSHKRLQVSHVCQHWRSLVINSPSMWTIIHIPSRPSRWPRLVLERSGTAMLNASLQLSMHHSNPNGERLILQNISRIRTLDIEGEGINIINWDKFQALLNSSGDDNVFSGETTVLERVSIKFTSNSSVPTLSMGWFTIAPHLQHLKLSGIGFDWNTSHFRNLRTLHVMAIPAVTQLTLDRIQTVFGKMSLLEDLCLSHVFSPEDRNLPPIPSSKCNLSNLRKLRIESTSSSSIALFLLSMSFPSLDHFHINVTRRRSNTDDHSYFFQALSTILQHAYPTISIENIYVNGRCEKITFGMYLNGESEDYDQISLPVAGSEAINLGMISNFCTVTDFSCLKRLLVEDMPPRELRTNFGSLPHLTSIVVFGNETFTDLIGALMIPLDYPQHAQLTFPALRSITADHLSDFTDKDAGWEPLQDCLMQRYEYGAPLDDLKIYSFRKCSPDCATKLSEIVPCVTVAKMRITYTFT